LQSALKRPWQQNKTAAEQLGSDKESVCDSHVVRETAQSTFKVKSNRIKLK